MFARLQVHGFIRPMNNLKAQLERTPRFSRHASIATQAHIQPLPIPVLDNVPLPSQQSTVMNTDKKHFTSKRFVDAPISQLSKAGIRHEFLTDVQDATLEHALSGIDLLVQAKTGTGKTTAFLLPAIERLASSRSTSSDMGQILVIAPTRELVLQIEEEAISLLAHHPYGVQSVIGGTNINTEKNRLNSPTARTDILIATPGRLLDHLTSGLILRPSVLILDEADRLLDQGFRKDLERIVGFLPDRRGTKRQCMLFSATFDEAIRKIAKIYLDPNYKFISTLHADEINTHEHVPQSYLITPLEDTLPTLVSLLKQAGPQAKTMLFCTTARGTAVVASVLQQVSAAPQSMLPPIYQIQSRMSQAARTRAAQEFRDAPEGAILVTSDVTARGMDFPSVTHIIQLSLPSSPAQYIHRLGRTARAGAAGEGILMLMPDEQFFLRLPEIASLPLTPHTQIEHTGNLKFKLDDRSIGQAYSAWLGFYKSWLKQLRWSPTELVKQGAVWAQCLGWPSVTEVGGGPSTSGGAPARIGARGGHAVATWIPPPIAKRTVGLMGLRGTPGLNVVDRLDDVDNGPARNAGGGGRGRGGGGGKFLPKAAKPHTEGGSDNRTARTQGIRKGKAEARQ
ncbi:P-loop containing nucleoside triphosphate hydrolase protein [Suillus bovinus]|uniref:P-loop containing nucleoside triphosphate hydrolase protein n=1 Tax=Suillus bovinus TaxID=48563 RepID=UPI001B882B5B|nr:P-loop containing nucleoside triphosphate hydrolase protein [Suillus bovinus]KAG2157620.1 P-loop containing nucleoside triphosphate hydrolase protein [Suillus bovinus]